MSTIEGKSLKVGVFIPSCIDQFSPQTGRNLLHLLRQAGCQCYYPSPLTDSGAELYFSGDREGAKMLGERLIEMYKDCAYVVSCGSGDVAYVRRYFGELFNNTAYHNESHRFAEKMFDISHFLVHVAHFVPSGLSFPHRVAFMDHCRTLRDYGIKEEPRQLLQAIDGLELCEIAHQGICCGFGSVFTNSFEPISTEMARQKVNAALVVGAQYLVSTEPSCLMHLQSYIDKVGLNLQCRNFVDLMV